MSEFVTKDSGERKHFASGMQRDTTAGKARPDLVRSGPMFQRWVALLTRGAAKYDANNWMKANGQAELDRFLESAARHFEVWFTWRKLGINIEDPNHPTREPLTEDHAAAVFFNLNGAEYVADRMVPSVSEDPVREWIRADAKRRGSQVCCRKPLQCNHSCVGRYDALTKKDAQ